MRQGGEALIDQTAIVLGSKSSALNALLVTPSRAAVANIAGTTPIASRRLIGALMMLCCDPARHNAHGRVFGKTLQRPSVDSSTAVG